jgi:NAD(P)-dependent dehydrogenase (short-subunit alcohol dehydrogenase family)
MMNEKWTIEKMPDLHGKICLVTGGNSGLGFETVKAFAKSGATVILARRSMENGTEAKSAMGNVKGKIHFLTLDLMDFDSIKAFSENFRKKFNRLDILVNNAGIMTTPYFLTKNGLEAQMGTNHFGHFALTGLLLDLIKNTPDSRVVNVSSMAHKQGKMDFQNLLFEKGSGYSPIKSYGRSKLMNLLFTFELQRFFESNNINSVAVAAHPGVSNTNLARYLEKKPLFKILKPLISPLIQSQAMGALPQIRASVDEKVQGGDYYGPDGFREMKGFPVKVEPNKDSQNLADARKLWEISEKLTGIRFQ